MTVAIGLLLLVLVVGGIGVGGWVATAPGRADSALVLAVVREAAVAARIAEAGPGRETVEEAWFQFDDHRTPENAAAYIRAATEAAAAGSPSDEVKRSVWRMEEALRAWERAHGK